MTFLSKERILSKIQKYLTKGLNYLNFFLIKMEEHTTEVENTFQNIDMHNIGTEIL